ncbi:uncharacterized protein NECHADRAFT_75267 [Fusarium vanettenii 77-13-4]|uniref:EKC/KEOPS complex subunit BUD32 n=1 Tax=Fusarium vanettenii (strain ATCC MYA-4622 / CBS 123669 / FGSC 9596 / NRRL 45880 / 77-13-4) TaxID=660122 RepID=C7YIC1_FUSV7|nr:uncharacterized protein NECHADRAFT_75267 [Fusarium vanettenii 77-13-4]EEU48073.1 hypothetical protein NECHADRAFT_75267 [Fusarium vanettenii 77-13-4]
MSAMTTTTQLSLPNREKETDPAYVDCFGDQAHTTESKRFGKIILWRIVGELACTAIKIQDTLSKLIAENRAVWQSRRPNEVSPFEEPPYLIRCFLIGASTSHSAPCVTIISSVEWFSNCLKDIILKGKILAAYPGWRCFRLPIDPQLTAPGRLQMSLPTNDDLSEYRVFIPGGVLPAYINATRIEIWKGQSYVGSATVGGMVTVGDEHLALTVAHAIYPQQPPIPDAFEIDDSELDFLEYYDVEEDTCSVEDLLDADIPWPTAAVSSDITPSSTIRGSIESPPTSPDLSKDKILIGHLLCLSDIQRGGFSEPGALDWALIKITNAAISNKNQPSPILCHGEIGTNDPVNAVKILTSSAALDGLLVSDAVFGLPGFGSPQPVRVANVGTVQKGDSGSWVIQRSTQKPVGMLIGCCQPLNESYLLVLEDIVQDIEAQTGLAAKVAPSDPPSHAEQLDFFRFVDDHKRSGVNGQGEEAWYISHAKLKTYWKGVRLLECLGLDPRDEISAADEILARYLRVFSCLVYIGEHDLLQWFVDRNFHDECLPAIDLPSWFPGSQHVWEMFRENQWMFIPLRLNSDNTFDTKVHPNTILPIVNQQPLSKPNQGDFSCSHLTRVQLDEDCLDEGSNRTVVFKTYDINNYQDLLPDGNQTCKTFDLQRRGATKMTAWSRPWQAESALFRALNERGGSRHIVSPVASFQQGDRFYTIFEWHNGGNLSDFWKHSKPPKEPVRVLELWESLFDLLKAIERLHYLLFGSLMEQSTICHGDLRPENILVFPQDAGGVTLKLADFGLSRFHTMRRDRAVKTAILDVEVDRRKVDIWALGYVLTETLLWLNGGDKLRQTLNRQAVVQQTSLRHCQETLGRVENLDRVSSVVRTFIRTHMLVDEPGSAREIFRRFHDDVLPVADLNEEDALESLEQVADLPAEPIMWETRSQRLSVASSTATTVESEVDSGFFSATVTSSVTKPTSSHASGKLPVRQESFDDSGQSLTTVDDINQWIHGVPKTITSSSILGGTDRETETTSRGARAKAKMKNPHWRPTAISQRVQELGGRDWMFLVDDSASMRQHWADVSKTVRAIEWLLSDCQESSMDLFFTSEPLMGYQRKQDGFFTDIVRSQQPWGICAMKDSLETVFDRVITDRLRPGVQTHASNQRPMTIYILTNGVWETSGKKKGTPLAGVTSAIKRIANELENQGKNRKSLAIQFIRFGNDESGGGRLKDLDDWCHNRQPHEGGDKNM